MHSSAGHRRKAQSSIARIVTHGFMVLCLLSSLVPGNVAFAATADKIYVTPSSSQMNIGTTFCVDVISYAEANADPGTAVGTLNYDSGKLQAQVKQNGKKCPDSQGNDNAASYYATRSATAQNGAIAFDASQPQADGGIRYVFSVIFTAQAAGTASVTFSSGKLNGSQPTLKGGSYTINAPPAPATPKPSTSAPKPVVSVTPITDTQVKTPSNTSVVPETKTDPTGLIDGVIASPTFISSTITWKVNASNSRSTISYGTSSDKLDKTADVKKLPDGSYSTTFSNLSPGIYYYYTITGSGEGVPEGNYSSSFVTNGYPVTIQITENNVAVQAARVKIGEQTLTANNGSLTVGLAAGDYTGTITTDTATLKINLTVKALALPSDGTAPATQQFGPYNLTSAPLSGGPGSNVTIFAFIGILVGGTVILAFGFLGFIAYRRRKFESNSYSTPSSTTVIIDDGYDWRQKSQETQMDTITPPTLNEPTSYPQQDIQPDTAVEPTKNDEPLDMFEKAGIPAPKIHGSTNQKS